MRSNVNNVQNNFSSYDIFRIFGHICSIYKEENKKIRGDYKRTGIQKDKSDNLIYYSFRGTHTTIF